MKQHRTIYIIFLIMFFCVNVNALEKCTTEKMNNLKEIADKVELHYTYEMKKNSDFSYPEFTIIANNLNSDLKVLVIGDFYSMNYREFTDKGNGSGTLSGFMEGETVSVTMKAYTIDECSTKTVLIKQVKLPYYNYFYDKEFCLTNPNFKYCSEFLETRITQEQYDKEKESFLNSNNSLSPVIQEDNSMLIIFIVIIAVFILLIIGLIIFIIKKRKKNKL